MPKSKKPNPNVVKYGELMDEFDRKPLIGTHELGDLTITCSHRFWQVTDGTNTMSGTSKTATDMRYAIRRHVISWAKLQA